METPAEATDSDSRQLPQTSTQVLSRLVPNALGAALGTVTGLGVLAVTVVLVLRGGIRVGTHLGLLGYFFPGYQVTLAGAMLGGFYGFVSGYVIGFAFAALRNAAVACYLRFVWTRLQHHVASDLLDRMS